jgi:NAD(P)-dependent dehydrogenase (short-subunit alcohol dehydrogenase family)
MRTGAGRQPQIGHMLGMRPVPVSFGRFARGRDPGRQALEEAVEIESAHGTGQDTAVQEVVIVTGGARGLGRTYALALAEAGYAVVVADIGDVAPVVGEIEAARGAALGVHVDVADRAATEAMAAETLDRFGRIDVLVNNAAVFTEIVKRPFEDLSVEEWDRCFAVNVRGSWLCARAVVPAMKRQGSGKVINV